MEVATKTRPQTKVFELTHLKIDPAGEGTFEAAFANLNAVDRDGDGYDPGAIGEQRVMVSQWNHGSWNGGADSLPIGVGKTYESSGWGMIAGEFDMGDPDAVKTYRKLKYLKDKGFPVEWSFALPEADWRMEERDGDRIRIYTRILIPEVSPVLMGAGIDTHLTSIKSREGKDVDTQDRNDGEAMPFAKQLDEAVETVESVLARAKEIRNLRAKSEKDGMSRRSTRRLKALRDAMQECIEDVDDLLTDPNDELTKLAATFEEGHRNGVQATG